MTRSRVVLSAPGLLITCLALGAPLAGCEPTGDGGPTEDPFVGRWAGQSLVDDFGFADGRDVRLDEVFELSADGTMRGDFAGWDPVTRCVVTYRLRGVWGTPEDDAIDVSWTSIRSGLTGCTDETLDAPDADVTAEEGELWNDELGGFWTVTGSNLRIAAANGTLAYTRVEDDFVGRWTGQTLVDDLAFADGRDVALDEMFWLNQDGTMVGYFTGTDDVSGCTADYRLQGRWSLSADAIDVAWSSISSETFGCDDASLDEAPTEVVASEGDLWDEELDGDWVVEGDTLRISTSVGDTIEYARAL